MTTTVDAVRHALHDAGIGCKPNVPYCRATHTGHALRIVGQLRKQGFKVYGVDDVNHARLRNHDYNPSACDGCAGIAS
jgi:hypothetical protein